MASAYHCCQRAGVADGGRLGWRRDPQTRRADSSPCSRLPTGAALGAHPNPLTAAKVDEAALASYARNRRRESMPG
jgi:hypothetical protein